ncbi:MAG: ABC transporter ATP-binding protein [Clostridia bacterium]|nr:ABC transporter ATP-binding protein [Clostridia bacterium]
MIRSDGISFSYGKSEILKSLSFSAEDGECLVFAGPNGSGKSTALGIISGALKSSSGTVHANGKIGYIPQGSALLEDATVKENLRFFAKLSKSSVPETLPFSVSEYMNKKVAKLSGGMKKQVSIACALIGDPQIILLDEPCAALDITFRDELIGIIEKWKREGKTVVYVGHDPSEFYTFFDTIIFFDNPPLTVSRREIDTQTKTAEAFAEFYKDTLLNIKRK